MGKEIMTFCDTEIEKHKLHGYKSPILLKYVDVNNILVSKNISSVEKSYKYFIGYLCGDYKLKPLHIMLPKTRAYVQIYNGYTKWMYFLIDVDYLLKKYNNISDKVSADIKNKLIANLFIRQ